MATASQWHDLLDQFRDLNRRFAAVTPWHPDTDPNPGATDDELRDAEARLGRELHPDHRLLLSIANGWDGMLLADFLGTADIGHGPRWESSQENLTIFARDSAGAMAEWMGVDDVWDDCVVILHDDNGYSGHQYMFTEDGRGRTAGDVFTVVDEAPPSPDLYSRWVEELAGWRAFVEDEERGSWSKPWDGRNIGDDPPSIGEILDRIDEVLHDLDAGRLIRRSGATDDELDAVADTLGDPLTEGHRALLRTSDGLDVPIAGLHVLATEELSDRQGWTRQVDRAVECEQASQDRVHRQLDSADVHNSDGEASTRRAPVRDRVGKIPATPFAVTVSGPDAEYFQVYGIDVRDGAVRNLLMDIEVGEGAYEAATVDVADYFLRLCCILWQTLQHRRD